MEAERSLSNLCFTRYQTIRLPDLGQLEKEGEEEEKGEGGGG